MTLHKNNTLFHKDENKFRWYWS